MKTKRRPTNRSRHDNSGRRRRCSNSHSRRRALFVERLEVRTLLATIVWDGEGGDNAWGNAANWFNETTNENNVLPGTGDDVEIRAPFADEVISLVLGSQGTTVNLNSLQSAAGLHIQGGSHAPTSLMITGTAQFDGPVSLVSGNFGGGGILTINDKLTWTGGTLAGGGTLVVAPGATLAFDPSGGVFSSGSWTIENEGTFDWIQGNLNAADPLTFNNRPGALFDVRNDATFGSGNSGRIFNNEGTLRKSEGTDRSQMAMIFNNTGSVEVETGTLAIVKGGVSSGDFSFDAGTTLELRGGDDFFHNTHTITLGDNDSIAGQGRLLIADRPITIQGTGVVDIASLEISTRNGAHLQLNLDATVPSVLLAQGTLGGTGTLTVTQNMNWTGGQMGDGGTTQIAAEARLTVDAATVGMALGGRTIENFGNFEWLRGNINASGSAPLTINNRVGALLDIRTSGTAGSTGSVLNNFGTVRKSASTGRSEFAMVLNSTHVVEVQAGTLAFTRGGTSSGNFSFDDGTTLELHGSLPGFFDSVHTITLGPTDSMAGEGRLLIATRRNIIQGSGFFAPNTLEVSTSAFAGVQLNVDATVPNVILSSGSLGGTGTLTVSENMTWTGGNMADSGTTVIERDAILRVNPPTNTNVGINDGDSMASPTRTIDNHGTIEWLSGNIFLTDPLLIFNRPSAVFDMRADASISPQGTLINTGTIRKTAGSGTTVIDMTVSNGGAVEALSGTLRLVKPVTNWSGVESALVGGTWLVSTANPLVSSATLRLDGVSPFANNRADITLDGPGTSFINQSSVDLLRDLRHIATDGTLAILNDRDLSPSAGDFTNDGTLTVGPASTLTVTGHYTQSADATLAIGLGGDTPSGLFGHLNSTSTANIDGTFELRLYDGFGPTTGQTWQVMSFPDRVGAFAQFVGLRLGATQAFEVIENPDDVTINALIDANDLAVDPLSIEITGSGIVGEQVTVTYSVNNLTDLPAVGEWVDSIYLSTDTVLDPFDVLLGRVTHTGGVAGLGSYTETLVATLPAVLPNNYRIIVVEDSRGLVPDKNRSDNTAVSPGVIQAQYRPLLVGGSVSDVIASGQSHFFQLEVPPDADVLLTGSFAVDFQAAIYARLGGTPSRTVFDERIDRAPASSQPSTILTVPGTYYLMVHGDTQASAGEAYTLSAESVQLAVSAVLSPRGSNQGTASTAIHGTGFTDASVVELLGSGDEVVATASARIRDAQVLYATFDLTGVPVGQYSLRVRDGVATAAAPVPYSVTSESAQALSINLETHHRTLVGREGTFLLRVHNPGGTDVPAELVTITAAGATLRLGHEGPYVGQQLQVLAFDPAGPGDVIPPGKHFDVQIFFRSLSPSQGNQLVFMADRADAEDTPFDASQWEDQFRPAHLSDEAWLPVLANLSAQLGTTIGQYNAVLRTNSAYLASLGEATHDVRRLVALELMKADDGLLGLPLAQARDAAAPTASLPLTFDRTYQQSISTRYRLGALGRGWMHDWEIRLIEKPGGDIFIESPEGNRYFQFLRTDPGLGDDGIYFGSSGYGEVLRRIQGSFASHLRYRRADGTVFTFLDDPADLSPEKPLLGIEDPYGQRIDMVYFDGRISEMRHTNGQSLHLSYNVDGRLETLTDHVGRVTTYTYDASGEYLLNVSSPFGVTNYTYDTASFDARRHALLSIERPDGTHQFYEYDALGRLSAQFLDVGAERLDIGYSGGEVTLTDAEGAANIVRFDDRGRIRQLVDADGGLTSLHYGEQPSLVTHILLPGTGPIPFGSIPVELDQAGRLNRVVRPDGTELRFVYDASGNVTELRDAAGNIVRQSFATPLFQEDRFTYEPRFSSSGAHMGYHRVRISGNVASARPVDRLGGYIDEAGFATQYLYDGHDSTTLFGPGDLTNIVYPNGSQQLFAYDTLGNVTESVNRRGQSIDYTYNAVGQLTEKQRADGRVETFTYDARGNLTGATDASGTTAFDYDAADRLIRVAYPNGRELTYTHNAAGRRTSISDQDGFAIHYSYDVAGRLAEMRDAGGDLIAGYSYDGTGRLLRQENANGTFTTYVHDSDGRVAQIANHAPGGAVRSQIDYAYDALGRRTSQTVDGDTTTYEYDANGQLTQVQLPSGRTIAYVYDEIGNRLSVIDDGQTTDYVVDSLQQYPSVGDAVRRYDADGNLVRIEQGSDVTAFQYDDESRLIGVVSPAGVTTYEYDALGNRIASTHNGVRTEYLIDPTGLGNIAAQYDSNGNLIARFSHGDFGLVSQHDAVGTAAFYEFDFPGSTTAITGAGGAVLNEYEYLPFGELLSSSESIANPFTFVGALGVMAEENGLTFMRNRYYQSDVGAFTSLDPLRVPPIELYGYAKNDPLRNVDPLGLRNFPGLDSGPADGLDSLQNTPGGAGAAGVMCAVAGGIASGVGPAGQVLGRVTGAMCGAATGSNEDTFNGLRGIVRQGECGTSNAEAARQLAAIGFPGCSGTTTTEAASLDPNDIIGPAGVGPENHLTTDAVLPYTIRFENLDTATAPAHQVVILHTLDADLDFDTFQLDSFGFGGLRFEIPAGQDSYDARVEISDELFVDFSAELNRATRLVTWRFTSIDPQTLDLPADPDLGFLPPNVMSPDGEGFVEFSIRALPGLETGTRLDAVARIFFDTNEPIDTPAIFNTVDAGLPTSSIDPLPAETLTESFTVSWSGADDAGGSGIASYDIFVSENGGPFTLLLFATTETSTTFTGQVGHSYGFYSVARDLVGFVQPTPLGAQATTTINVNNVAPALSVAQAEVVAAVGSQVVNSGTYGDVPADTITLTASLGDVFVLGDGQWVWMHQANSEAPQSVTITASNGDGGESEVTFELVTFTLPPLVVSITGDENGDEGETLSFTASVVDLANTGTPFTYHWNFGDGSVPVIGEDLVTVEHTFADSGVYSVSVMVFDDPAATGTVRILSVTVNNVAPTVVAAESSVTVLEGATATNTGTFGHAGADSVTITSSVGSVTQDDVGGTWIWSFATTDGPAQSQIVTITATDSDDAEATATFELTVTNVPPTVAVDETSVTVTEGSTATNTGTFGDVGDDTVTVTASVGSITQDDVAGTWIWSFATTDGPAQSQMVTITATDSDDAETSATFELTVTNVPPTVAVNDPSITVERGNTATNSGTFGDVGDDIVTVTASIGTVTQNQAAGTWSWEFATDAGSDDSQVVTITATDSDGATTQTTFELVVNTVDPIVRMALQLDADLELSPTNIPRQGLLGLNEKWLRGINKQLYYITPAGEFYSWQIGFPPTSTQIATLSPEYHANPALLHQAAMFLDTSPEALPSTLALLDEAYGFKFADEHWEDWGNRGEKWFKDRDNDWYFILPNGEVYLWDGRPRATGELIFNVGATVHADPSLLWNAYVEPEGEAGDTELSALSGLTTDSLSFVDITPPFPIRIGAWTNPLNALDVNRDGSVSPLDVLIVINRINEAKLTSQLGANGPASTADMYYDVTNDGSLSPQDALLIVNALNDPFRADGEAWDNLPALGQPADSLDDDLWGIALEQFLAEEEDLFGDAIAQDL